MTDAWDSLAILRQCRRCRELLPLGESKPLAKLCKGCCTASPYKVTDYIARNRALAITESGRELLRQWRDEAA